jgi:murein DD-endopeptidase MepM/ murein hydrolase activator NlpD
MKDKFSIIIVPHDERKTRTYRIKYKTLYTLLVILAVGVIALAVFAVTYGKLLLKTKEIVMLQRKVERLTERNEKLKEIVANIDDIKKMSKQVKMMLGVNTSKGTDTLKSEMKAEESRNNRIQDEKNNMLRAIPSFWPVRGFITKKFNVSVEESKSDYHRGIDIAVQRGQPVRAAALGYVIETGWDKIFGYSVRIDHGYGIKTLYGHNERIVVKEGERVERGQTIAYSGNSGRSSAPHLHFEVTKNNISVDPLKYLLQ